MVVELFCAVGVWFFQSAVCEGDDYLLAAYKY